EHRFAVAIAIRIGKGDIRRERHVALHLLPEEPELVARVPDVVAGRTDRVTAVGEARAAGYQRRADVGLRRENADGRAVVKTRTVEIPRRRHLLVGCGA